MGRYFLFAGDFYYPAGGWSDFQGDYSSEDAAVAEGQRGDFDWLEIVDSHLRVVVRRFQRSSGSRREWCEYHVE